VVDYRADPDPNGGVENAGAPPHATVGRIPL
jgi:hypothetical protein